MLLQSGDYVVLVKANPDVIVGHMKQRLLSMERQPFQEFAIVDNSISRRDRIAINIYHSREWAQVALHFKKTRFWPPEAAHSHCQGRVSGYEWHTRKQGMVRAIDETVLVAGLGYTVRKCLGKLRTSSERKPVVDAIVLSAG